MEIGPADRVAVNSKGLSAVVNKGAAGAADAGNVKGEALTFYLKQLRCGCVLITALSLASRLVGR